MTTASQLCQAALRKLGVLAAGETMSSEDAADTLEALNRLLDAYNIPGLVGPSTTTQDVSWAATVSSKTIGTGGVVNTTRPSKIIDAVWELNSVIYPLDIIPADEWLNLDPQDQQGTPEVLYYDTASPLGTMHLWSIPSEAGTLRIQTQTAFSALALTDTINLPNGYERFIVYNLAVEMAPEYGREPSQTVMMIANESRADVKRLNLKVPKLLMPDNLPGVSRTNHRGWIGNG